MPELSNQQLVEFSNSDLRQIADLMVRIDTRTSAANATYLARDLSTIINDGGSTELIADGSATDGRTRCAGGDVFNLVTLMGDFQTFLTQGRKDVLAKWKVQGSRD